MTVFDGTDDDRSQERREGVQTSVLKIELFCIPVYEDGEEVGRDYAARYILTPADADGKAVQEDERQGDAIPHFTSQEKTGLRDLMDRKVDDANEHLGG